MKNDLSHYFTDDDRPDSFRNFSYQVSSSEYLLESDCPPISLGVNLALTSNDGVFSKDHVDSASDFLIRMALKREYALLREKMGAVSVCDKDQGRFESPLFKDLKIADIGTGYGVILLALLSAMPGATGLGMDVSNRALKLAKINLKKNLMMGRAEFVQGNILEWAACFNHGAADSAALQTDSAVTQTDSVVPHANKYEEKHVEIEPFLGKFDLVVTNPPIRAGKDVVYACFDAARAMLAEGGRFYAVISKNQGAKSSKKRIEEVFGNAEELGKSGEFRVFRAIKN